MPQLVKGGKYVFGWSHVSGSGKICIPEEARIEYHFQPADKIIIMNGSLASQGFCITTKDLIRKCQIYQKLLNYKALINFEALPNGFIQDKNKIYTWSEVNAQGCFIIDINILKKYHVNINDNVLVGRGSGFALAFIKTGRIVEEALRHPELAITG